MQIGTRLSDLPIYNDGMYWTVLFSLRTCRGTWSAILKMVGAESMIVLLVIGLGLLLHPLSVCLFSGLQCGVQDKLWKGFIHLLAALPAGFLGLVVLWLKTPVALDKAPRQFGNQELTDLTNYLTLHAPSTNKTISFVTSLDEGATIQLKQAFSDAFWEIDLEFGSVGPDYRKGIWVSGGHRCLVRDAFRSAKIAISVTDEDADQGTRISCGE